MSDLISRDDAIRALNGACSNWEDDAKVQEIVMALPSAELPKGDLISRADAIEALRKKLQDWGGYAFEDYRRGLYEAQDILEALPSADAVDVAHDIPEYCSWSQTYTNMVQGAMSNVSAEAVQGWIPCSERLPDVDVEVLTTTDWSEILIAWYRKDGTWETDEYILESDEILAWMPLPTPYKGGDAE